MSHERGSRPSRIPGIGRLSELLPDPRRAAIPDILARNVFFQSGAESQHTTLTVGNTVTRTTDELQRIRSVQVGTVSGGTVTVQVQVEGRDIFDDTQRPVSAGAVREPTDVYTFPAGTPVSTIIEATSGVPTGNANVVLEIEPYVLLPRDEMVKLHGKDRLSISSRRDAERENAGLVKTTTSPIGTDRPPGGGVPPRQQPLEQWQVIGKGGTVVRVVPRGEGPGGGPRPRRGRR